MVPALGVKQPAELAEAVAARVGFRNAGTLRTLIRNRRPTAAAARLTPCYPLSGSVARTRLTASTMLRSAGSTSA